MSTGSLPRGFAPHHLGPPPRRPQQQQPPQQQRAAQQHMGAMYAPPAAAAAAPSLMKRPAAAVRDPYGASGPGVLQRQAPPAAQRHSGDYGGPQYAQPQYPPSTPGSMQYGAPSPYGMQGGYHPGQWADSNADTSVESIPPEGFHTPGANGQAYGDASADLTHMSPAPQSPYQHGKGAPQLLHADTPREGKKPPFLDGQQDGTPQFITRAAPHAQRSAAPPPPPAPAADVSQYAGFKSDLDGDTSLIRSEADKIAQRLLKTEQELERLKKQGDLIGESLRKQKALDIEAHHRTVPAQQVPTLPGHFDAEQWQAQADNKGVPAALQQQQQQPLPEKKTDPKTVSPTVAPSMAPHAASPAVGASPVPAVAKAASPPPQRAAAPVMQRAAAPVAQRAAAPPPQRAAAPNLGYPQPPTGAAEAPASAQPSSQKSPPPAQQSPPPQQPVTAAPKQPASPQFNYPMPPTPPTPPKQQTEAGGSSLSEVPNHPALKNPELAKSVVDDAQAESLGLPKGTMWFDPNDPAQMQMIKEQLEGKPAEAPAGPAGPPIIPKPKQATRHSRLVKEEELMDQKHSKLLHLPEEFDSQSQVIRCYKRLAPGLHPDVNKEPEAAAQLKSLTECCQVCLAELRKRSTAKVGELGTIGEEDEEEEEEGSPKKESGDGVPEGFILVDDVDPLEFYEEVFFHKQKHAQLKVKMGVSIEDLVNGNAAGFDIERRIVNDKGEQGTERCHLQVNVTPGMRPGTQFIFECEGDDAVGCVPGDVCVILKLEPHDRFLCAGSDLATEHTMTLADALTGAAIGPIHTVTGHKLLLHVPSDLIAMPEMILKAENEGLPLIEDPSRRGHLFVKVHVAFPRALRLTDEDKTQLRKFLEPEPIDSSLMNPRHNQIPEDAPERRAGVIPAPEQEFGMDADRTNPQPLLCKQM